MDKLAIEIRRHHHNLPRLDGRKPAQQIMYSATVLRGTPQEIERWGFEWWDALDELLAEMHRRGVTLEGREVTTA